ncbi:hypothetical protein [Aquitalea sp. ASV15]|uniref:hypothetical protein n=1 Tax=Aquitalea sp. ASV15 TaxID=2795104 RepID=UPI0018EA7372|nr:hypothetical protein [Aquitalea sp. ASV15]
MLFSTANLDVQLAKRLVSDLLAENHDPVTVTKLNRLTAVLDDLYSQLIAAEHACAMGKSCKKRADTIITTSPSQTD